jgi:hypothetical protein
VRCARTYSTVSTTIPLSPLRICAICEGNTSSISK